MSRVEHGSTTAKEAFQNRIELEPARRAETTEIFEGGKSTTLATFDSDTNCINRHGKNVHLSASTQTAGQQKVSHVKL